MITRRASVAAIYSNEQAAADFAASLAETHGLTPQNKYLWERNGLFVTCQATFSGKWVVIHNLPDDLMHALMHAL